MAPKTAGLAGNQSITLFAGIEDPTEPLGLRLIPLDSLDGPALDQWRRLLVEDPALVELLANVKTDDIQTGAPAENPLGENFGIPSGNTNNSKATDDANDKDRPGGGQGERQKTKVPTAGRDCVRGNKNSRNPSSKATGSSRQTASGATAAKTNKRKETTKKSTKNRPNVAIRCTPEPPHEDQQRNMTCSANDPEVTFFTDLEFTAPRQATNSDWHCEKLGWFYNLLAHPAHPGKRVPLPCMKCAGCIRYELHLKSLQYEYGVPAPIQTVMEFKARTPKKARKFTGNRQHARRLPGARRVSFLDQKALQDREDGTRKSCEGVLIWDGEIPERVRAQMESHARHQKMTHVQVYVVALDEAKLRKLLPSRLRLPGQKINTCHFSAGWAKKRLSLSDWRDGLCRVVGIDEGGAPVTEFWQPERGQRIARSWQFEFVFEWNNDLTPEERDVERKSAMPYLHRARYINFSDWFYCMSDRALEMVRVCINRILNGEEPNLKTLRTWTSAPKAMVFETAAFLMGEREPEPALTLAAEQLGFISMPGEFPARHIAPKFLAALTDQLPPLLEFEGPRVPPHLTAAASDARDVYSRLYANYPKCSTPQEPKTDAKLAMAA